MAKKDDVKDEAAPEPKPVKAEASCGNCSSRRGSECHFYPPQVTSAVFCAFPSVRDSDWCRQWEGK